MEASTTFLENSSAAAGDWEDEEGDEGMRVQAEEGVQCSTANRWPKQETLALLEIRSDMDVAFRDSVVKAPLWEEVSRKLNELGYNRSAKKCKEKFENIYKYHRRTKGSQSGRPNGKTYRFFEQLQALDKTNALVSPASSDKDHCLMPSASVNPVSFIPNDVPCSIQSPRMNCTDATSTSTASTSSEESEGTRKKKRRLTDFFERLMKEVIEKQENLQNKFLEAIEKCEQERIAREEVWKMQELDRIKREQELLVHERAIAAAKDAAVLAFLQKFSEQGIPVRLPDNPTVPMKFPDNQTSPAQLSKNQAVPVENVVKTHENSSVESFVNMSSSRWPKEEIESLIKIRTYLEFQYQENGPKGPLWEEISTSMKNLGYDRSAKRCKEKWENMNKYFKRVKDSNKKRPGDSKTCPYFQQLDALYREKTRRVDNPSYELKPEELLMHMMGGQEDQQLPDSATTEDREMPCNEKRDEAYFMNLLKVVESTPGLYYSYETDITLNLQRRCKLAEGWMSKPIWKSADPRFVWNKSLLEELIEFKLDEFIIPLLQGSFGAAQLKIKESSATVTLVSRRCTRRLGTRMWRRGANLEGDTANFIETEQLLELEGYRSSLLQIRGSIPLLWEQIVDLSYRPCLRIISHEQTSKVVERHFHDLYQRYGDTMAVDLTNKHGDEGQLSAAYAAEMQKLPTVRYVPFDFHHVCGNSNFDNLQILYNQISEDFQNQGYILIDAEGNILEEQKGIIRSNCIDCLDRTNVTQSFLGQKSLTMQLQRIGVLSSIEFITMFSEEYGKFRALWAEQGDEVSLEYAGTHALKGDLVRYGRQTIGGIIKDGMSALSRYYLNNFQDGVRQDALDLISGHYSVNRNGPSPFQLNGFESLSYLPVASAASALIIGGLTITSVTIQQAGRQAQQYLSTVIWAGVTAGVMAVVKANGRQFCSRPRLCGLM